VTKLTIAEKQAYIDNLINSYFISLIDEQIYSTIYNWEYELVICTHHAARSVGASCYQELIGRSYKEYNNVELAHSVFKEAYTPNNQEAIHHFIKKIYEIQQYVVTHNKVVNFIDLLPYNNQFKSYLETCIPLIHPSGEVIGIQSFSIETRFLGFQEHIHGLLIQPSDKIYHSNDRFSPREEEVLFLLANGVTQEQIAQILKVSRSTIATTIANLCVKFAIPGSNTKALALAAIRHHCYETIPKSLWQPNVIILEEEVAEKLTV
jgi:DNA-binding CsgD family transcriptional regulator